MAKKQDKQAAVASTRSKRTIYPSGKWSGIFSGEFFGSLFHTKGIELQYFLKRVTIHSSMSAATTSVSLANLTNPTAFLRTAADSTDRYWALGGRLFKTSGTDPKTGWAQDAIANTPTAPIYDLIEFSSSMYVPTTTDIWKLTAGTWTANWWTSLAGASALQATKPHRFFVQGAALCITDGRYVHTFDGTIATQQALTLPSQFQAQFGISTTDASYIGTKSLNAGNAEVFVWDRSNATYTARYDVGDSEVLCGFVGQGVPFIITKKGYIKRFSGQGFVQVAELPTSELSLQITNIDPNGIAVDGDTVKFFVDFGVLANLRLHSGLWTYEMDTNNLYHSSGIKNNVGKDYMQTEVAGAGAVKLTVPGSGRYLVGGQAYTIYSGTSIHGIFSLDESGTSGHPAYFMTPKIKASNVRAFWRQLFVRFPNFLNATDRIRVAYRTAESTTLPAYETITWVTATTFTGTNTSVVVGDFVEVLAGDNAGALAKITTITGSGTLTFTIDLTLNASTRTARAMYHHFTDLGTVTSQGIQESPFRITARANWIQFLVELRGSINSPAIDELIIDKDDVAF